MTLTLNQLKYRAYKAKREWKQSDKSTEASRKLWLLWSKAQDRLETARREAKIPE